MTKNKIFVLFISLWALLAFLSIGVNLTKAFNDAKNLYPLSKYEKRLILFGEDYKFINFLNNNTLENSRILFLTGDNKDFFLTRYFLYPKKIDLIWENSKTTIREVNKFDYLVSDKKMKLDGFGLFREYKNETGKTIWNVYIKK